MRTSRSDKYQYKLKERSYSNMTAISDSALHIEAIEYAEEEEDAPSRLRRCLPYLEESYRNVINAVINDGLTHVEALKKYNLSIHSMRKIKRTVKEAAAKHNI